MRQSCHNDGGDDGRVWDLTGFGEGLRNTASLRGRGGAGATGSHGGLHWTNNFDEVQDFEGQIRALAGGTGLMSDSSFNAGTRSQPLGDRKAGLSADLDALAAYVGSLGSFDPSPYRPSSSTLSTAAAAGKTLFRDLNCGSCHAGAKFTGSGDQTLLNVGTIKSSSGKRNWEALTGMDVPTLRDVWATAPYLHDGSAATLADAIAAHAGFLLPDSQLQQLSAYLRELGSDEAAAPIADGAGTGLVGRYYNNNSLSGTAVLTRNENIDFDWKSNSPGSGINANRFSVRWTGVFEAPATGTYRLQTVADDGLRLLRERGPDDQPLDRSRLGHGHHGFVQPRRWTARADHLRVLRQLGTGGSALALAGARDDELRRDPAPPPVHAVKKTGSQLRARLVCKASHDGFAEPVVRPGLTCPCPCRPCRPCRRACHRRPAGFSSTSSATIASVVSIRPAIDAAFCSAVRVTLVGSSTPISTRSPYSPVAAL